MCLSLDNQYLVAGDMGGLIYIWSTNVPSGTTPGNVDPKENGLVTTYELHKDQGQVSNLVPMMRPLSLFGLTANMRSFEYAACSPLQKNIGKVRGDLQDGAQESVLEIGIQMIPSIQASLNPSHRNISTSSALETLLHESQFETEQYAWISQSANGMLLGQAASTQMQKMPGDREKGKDGGSAKKGKGADLQAQSLQEQNNRLKRTLAQRFDEYFD